MEINELKVLSASVLAEFPLGEAFTISVGKQDQESVPVRGTVVRSSRPLSELSEVVGFLVEHGFLVNRFDVSEDKGIFWQMTEKGRDLRELGDWEKYEKLLHLRKAGSYDPARAKAQFVFWFRYFFTFLVGIVACNQAIVYGTKIQELKPLDPPSPYFVCTSIFFIFILFRLYRRGDFGNKKVTGPESGKN